MHTPVIGTDVLAHWSVPYVGLPWKEHGLTKEGVACWGLCRLVYADVLGIEIPDYASEVVSIQERQEIARVFSDGTAFGPWQKVESKPLPFDIIVFKRGGLDAHAGIVVKDGFMLHVCSYQDSHVAPYNNGRWKPRLSGFYRHTSRA